MSVRALMPQVSLTGSYSRKNIKLDCLAVVRERGLIRDCSAIRNHKIRIDYVPLGTFCRTCPYQKILYLSAD
ncbi:hypothetical protein CEXT_50631 [Caerostris extrusa]|uniref:Uncharacterized protein n=1 Tax=Caerostris extrusa TaxID=172846 RepID=A0AAV4X1Z8_CAEEX|nr:hypothetical protein CEXT_50631 [Caerostris extrusa]